MSRRRNDIPSLKGNVEEANGVYISDLDFEDCNFEIRKVLTKLCESHCHEACIHIEYARQDRDWIFIGIGDKNLL